MGVVYRAEDLLLRRAVALKVMRPEHVADKRRRARFLREARTAASLVHPNVATIYEVGETEETIFIAMQLVPGESLRATLRRGRVDVLRALRWATGIARALACAHESGIVHRDLKPDNIMVLPDDEVMLLDFGIAKALSDDSADRPSHPATDADPLTIEGAIVGTPEYVSPEQARGEAVGVGSDVFSFGTLLVEMLTGRSPFRRASAIETLTAVIFEKAPSVDERDLDAIAARCLAKDPRDRFRDAGELLAALGALKGGAMPRAAAISRTMAGETLGDTGSPAIVRNLPRRTGLAARHRTATVIAVALGAAVALALIVVPRLGSSPRTPLSAGAGAAQPPPAALAPPPPLQNTAVAAAAAPSPDVVTAPALSTSSAPPAPDRRGHSSPPPHAAAAPGPSTAPPAGQPPAPFGGNALRSRD